MAARASDYYPPDLPTEAICMMEGCRGNGVCPDCGRKDYALLGYRGAIRRWAKAWGVTEREAEDRIVTRMEQRAAAWDALHGITEAQL
jgi:hypothetical protein